jgi:hypothetical protein
VNPFEFGRDLGTGELVDCVTEVAEVQRTIRDGGKLFLIGPRRYGKTSILRTAADKLEAKKAVVIRINAESCPSLDIFVGRLIALAAAGLRGPVERVGSDLRSFFNRLRPEMTFNVSHQSWTAKLGVNVAAPPAEQIRLLVEALDGLEALAAAQPVRRAVGLIIDEFQHLIELGGASAEAQIRSAIQQHKRIGYVFAGSKTRMLTDMTMDATRPFYRLGSVRFLGPVPAEDFLQFLITKFTDSGFTVPKQEALELILNLAEHVPYNVQMLASACWYDLRDVASRGKAALTEQIVQGSLDRLIRQQDPFYTQLWLSMTSIQQKTLFAVILGDGVNLQGHQASLLVGRGISTVQRAVESLIDRDILRHDQAGGKLKIRFEDPFFAAWIRAFNLA